MSKMIYSIIRYKVDEYHKLKYKSEKVIQKTNYGPVMGFKMPCTDYGYDYYSFQGIPYAKPPVGPLRFKAPEKPDPWTEPPLEFYKRGSAALQKDMVFGFEMGAEDCLHLSVYTKDLKPSTLRPVMVWIHGGGYFLGNNAKELYNPEILLRNDVVLITINYRLGAFGFLSLRDPDLDIPGNAGLKDQRLALKWVNENCHHFGGDPKNITLFGESAGGTSTSLHMVSESCKGLFSKAIVMSGSAFCNWAAYPFKNFGERLARNLGWNGIGGDKAIYALLKDMNCKRILRQQEKMLTLEDRVSMHLFEFGPTIEPYASDHCFLSDDPKILARNCWSNNIPAMIGYTDFEGLLLLKIILNEAELFLSNEKLKFLINLHELGIDPYCDKATELGNLIRGFFFGFADCNEENIVPYLHIQSDVWFVHGVHRKILCRQNAADSAPTYVYRFGFESNKLLFLKHIFADVNIPGTCHGEEIPYLFKPAFVGQTPLPGSREFSMLERFSETFAAFATNGDPNNPLISEVHWDPIKKRTDNSETDDSTYYKVFLFNDQVSFVDLPETRRMQFWDGIYEYCGKDLI